MAATQLMIDNIMKWPSAACHYIIWSNADTIIHITDLYCLYTQPNFIFKFFTKLSHVIIVNNQLTWWFSYSYKLMHAQHMAKLSASKMLYTFKAG